MKGRYLRWLKAWKKEVKSHHGVREASWRK